MARAPSRVPSPHPAALIAGLVAGPVLWTLQLCLGYFLTSLACVTGVLDPSVARALIVVATGVAVVLTGVAGWVAYATWARLKDVPERPGNGVDRWLALIGTLASGLFGLMLLMAGVPALVLRSCR